MWRNPVTGEGYSDSAHLAQIQQMDLKEKAEENRLLYVAMTRAQNRLILSHAERKRSSHWQKLAESAVPESVAPLEPVAARSVVPGLTEDVLDLPAVSA